MKHFQSLTIILISAAIGLLLAGCSKQETSGDNAASNDSRTPPLSMQLALGTLSLEGTEDAVTSEQAAELLPLWKAAKSLSTADNVTTEEMDGLYKQIQKAMTPAQMEAIQSMDLSGENLGEVMKNLGMEAPANPVGELSPEIQATMQARRASGERPEQSEGFVPGSGPGGGMGAEFGGGPPPGFSENRQNNQDGQSQPRRGINSPFFDPVIKLLEEKIQ